MNNTRQRKKLKIEIPIVIIISLITGIMAYLNQYYHAEGVEDALESDVEVTVTKTEDGYFFDGKGTESAMVFYPGAKVEEISYAPLMKQLAANGLDCYLVTMPGNLAIFGMNKATDVMTAYKYKHWYIGGHSLGGAMAASYAADHADELDGLLLLAAYSILRSCLWSAAKMVSSTGINWQSMRTICQRIRRLIFSLPVAITPTMAITESRTAMAKPVSHARKSRRR